MEILTADLVDDGSGWLEKVSLLVDDEGIIAAIGDRETLRAENPQALDSDFSGHIITPGLVNAHSHAFQVLLRGHADHPKDFHDWVATHLYPTVQTLDDRTIEVATLVAAAQMVKAGVTSLGEFHYLHNGEDGPGGARIDSLVLAAARRVGLRTSLIRTFYDRASRPGQERFAETPEQAVAATRELAAAFESDPLAHVMPAPHSLHGASPEMIQAAAELAAELDTPWHIHLSEQQSDLDYARDHYEGKTPLEALDSLGVLSDRTVLVHGLWLTESERARLAEVGGGLVYNPATNMYLGDGVLALDDLLERGVRVGLGTDADTTLSIWNEARQAEALQRVTQLRMGVTANVSAKGAAPARSARPLMRMATEHGAALIGQSVGRIAVGKPADLVVIDRYDLSLLPGSIAKGEALLNVLFTSMVPETAIRHVYVQGQRVLTHGELVCFSQEELVSLLAECLR